MIFINEFNFLLLEYQLFIKIAIDYKNRITLKLKNLYKKFYI